MLRHEVGAFNERGFLKYTHEPDNFISLSSSKGDAGLHPTQKPLKLMSSLIELTTIKDQIVMDPFCGSGSALVSAYNLGRRFIGIELKREYSQIASERMEKLARETEHSLFEAI